MSRWDQCEHVPQGCRFQLQMWGVKVPRTGGQQPGDGLKHAGRCSPLAHTSGPWDSLLLVHDFGLLKRLRKISVEGPLPLTSHCLHPSIVQRWRLRLREQEGAEKATEQVRGYFPGEEAWPRSLQGPSCCRKEMLRQQGMREAAPPR